MYIPSFPTYMCVHVYILTKRELYQVVVGQQSAAILDGTTMSIIELVRDIWMSNACVKFEERSLSPSKVIALIAKL